MHIYHKNFDNSTCQISYLDIFQIGYVNMFSEHSQLKCNLYVI